MIESLTLHNFQSHENTTVEFSSGINVIKGDNDKGKSSITRALYWLLNNKPSGDEFINWNASQCSVRAIINGVEIKRVKKSNENKYVIDGEGFKAVRSYVPDELNNIIKTTPTNFQMEDDPFFLLSSNPSDVARKLNDVVGLNKIDDSIQYPNKIVRQMNSSINHIQNDIQEKKRQLDRIKHVDEIEKKNQRLNKLLQKREEISKQIEEIESMVEDLEEQSEVLEQQTVINKLSKRIESLRKKQKKLDDLKEKSSDIRHSIKVIKSCENKTSRLHPIKNLPDKITELQNLYDQYSKLKDNHSGIRKTIKLINQNGDRTEAIKSEFQELNKKFNEEKKRIGACPTCGSTFKRGGRK